MPPGQEAKDNDSVTQLFDLLLSNTSSILGLLIFEISIQTPFKVSTTEERFNASIIEHPSEQKKSDPN